MISNLPPDKLYILFYILCNSFALIIFFFILYKLKTCVDKGSSNRLFEKVVLYNILYFTLKIIWVLIYKHKLFPNATYKPQAIANLLSFLGSSMAAYWWSLYINVRVDGKIAKTKRNRLLYSIFLNVVFLILIILVFTKKMYYTNEHGEIMNHPTMILAYLVPFAYGADAAILSIVSIIKRKNNNQETSIIETIYPQGLFISGVLQVIWPEIPFLCFGSAIAMICYYAQTIDRLVSIDALTRLNNRNALDLYLTTVLNPNSNSLYLMMVDVNDFKLINDKHGHIEGDKALQLISLSLKNGCKSNNNRPFIARYGGDEFIVICNDVTEEYMDSIKEAINTEIKKNIEEKSIGYDLSVSIGYTKYEPDTDTMQSLIARADEQLYSEKSIVHKETPHKKRRFHHSNK